MTNAQFEARLRQQKIVRAINSVLIYVFLTLVALIVLYPIIYLISAAFTPGTSISNLHIVPFGNGFTLDHFRKLFQKTNYLLWFKNTLIISLGVSAATVFVCTISAYVFSRFRFPFKKSMMLTFLILQILVKAASHG